jgi:uncharacterized delta-60 repeat protein
VPSGIAVARYDRDGNRDVSFGGDGLVVVDVGVTPAGNALLVQPDDSVIVAGRGGQDAVAVKVLADGTPDARFGVGGIARVDLGGTADEATGIVQQAVRSRIILGGTAAAGATDIAVAALTPRGELDGSFGVGGRAFIGGAGTVVAGTDIALDDDCSVVLSARADGDIGVARFRGDGSVDDRWGTGGLLRLDTGVHDGHTDQDSGNAVAVLPDGTYAVAGSGGNASLFLHRVAGSDDAEDYCPSPFGEGPLFAIGNDVEEGDSGTVLAPVNIVMDPAPAGFVSVDWSVRLVSAGEDDVQLMGGSLSLETEVPGFVIEIPVFGDTVDEPDEPFEIRAEVVAGPGTGAQAVGTVTILDDDEPGSTPAPTPRPETGCPATPFVDVDPASVHADAIECLVELGIVAGTSPTTFDPAGTLTRGQAASLLQRIVVAAGGSVPAAPSDAFADDDGSVHASAIDQLAALGIVTGRADGTFGPGDVVTRGQFVAMLARAYRVLTGGEELPAGVVTGTADGTLHASDPVRRDQSASFLHRLWTNVG